MAKQRTQEQVFNQTKARLAKRKHHPVLLSQKNITDILRQIYDKTLSGPRFFYSQDEYGMPLTKIPTQLGDKMFFCTITDTNTFSARDWVNVPQPASFRGSVWPLKRLAHLTGSPGIREVCVECDENDKKCDCQPDFMSNYFRDFWIENILLRYVGDCGYGAFARQAIDEGWHISEHTGKVQPHDHNAPESEIQYHTGISIGPNLDYGTTAWIESTHTGSVTRFLNHSCVPNCQFIEGRCGQVYRIVYIETLRDISKGEELTVNYGSKWFKDAAHPCLCGEPNCKNPPVVRSADFSRTAAAEVEGYEQHQIKKRKKRTFEGEQPQKRKKML